MPYSKLLLSVSTLTQLAANFCANQTEAPAKTVDHRPPLWDQRLQCMPDDIVRWAQLPENLGAKAHCLSKKMMHQKIPLSKHIWVLNAHELLEWLAYNRYGAHTHAIQPFFDGKHLRVKVKIISQDESSIFTLTLLAHNVHLLAPSPISHPNKDY